jgi:hypothetical protein
MQLDTLTTFEIRWSGACYLLSISSAMMVGESIMMLASLEWNQDCKGRN